MTRRSTVSDAGLVSRHLRSRASTSIALAVLVGLAVAVGALLPRGLVVLSDAELQHQLADGRPGANDLYGSGTFGDLDLAGTPTSAQEVFGSTDTALADLPQGLEAPLAGSLGDVSWFALLPADLVSLDVPRVRVQPVLSLALDLTWQTRVTMIEGTAPVSWNGNPDVPLEIAVGDNYAEQAGLAVGDTLNYLGTITRISGVYSVTDPTDSYWVHARELLSASVTHPPSSPTTVRGAAYIDPLSAAYLPDQLPRAELRAWYPLLAEAVTYAEVPELADQLRRLSSLGLYLPSGEGLVFETGIPASLDRVTSSVNTVAAVSALAGSAPLGALIAVLALGTRAVLDRRRATLLLASSRGASWLQLRATMLIEGMLVALPAAAIALIGVVVLLPVPVAPSTYVLPVLTALAVPLLFAGSPLSGAADRSDLGAGRSRTRWILELVVVGVAALALFLLLRRGLVVTSSGTVDPLLAATPLLLSLVVCVVLLRVYPLPLLALQRGARNSLSPVSLVGATGSIRASRAAFVSVLAMVVGVSSIVFSLVFAATVTAGLATSAASQTGADIRVEAATIVDLESISAVPGVRRVAALDIVPGVEIVFGNDTPDVTVVFADLAALHDVRPDIPVVRAGSMLVSSDIEARTSDVTTVGGVPITRAGVLPQFSLPGVDRSWVLVDVADEPAIVGEQPSFGTLLIATGPAADIAATATQVAEIVLAQQRDADRDRVEVVDTASLVADATSRPTIAGLTVALLAAAALSFLLCVIAVALGALGASSQRSRTLGVLRLLGMSPAQIRGVLAWELTPITVTALVAGTAFGVGLAAGMSALVDLRSVIGGSAAIGPTIPWALVAAAAGVFALVVGATGALSSAAADRVNAAAAVKMGAE